MKQSVPVCLILKQIKHFFKQVNDSTVNAATVIQKSINKYGSISSVCVVAFMPSKSHLTFNHKSVSSWWWCN